MSLMGDVVRLNPGKWLMATDVGRDAFQTGEQGYYCNFTKKTKTQLNPPHHLLLPWCRKVTAEKKIR